MSELLNARFAWEALRRRIDDPQNKAVVIIIVNQDDTQDGAAVNIDNPHGMYSVLFTALHGVTDEIVATWTPEQRARMTAVLPTREQAEESGLILPFRRKR